MVEHPIKELLPHKWALWHIEKNFAKNWIDCLKKIAVIESVEDFWKLVSILCVQ